MKMPGGSLKGGHSRDNAMEKGLLMGDNQPSLSGRKSSPLKGVQQKAVVWDSLPDAMFLNHRGLYKSNPNCELGTKYDGQQMQLP